MMASGEAFHDSTCKKLQVLQGRNVLGVENV
jgi:hypothetical protein